MADPLSRIGSQLTQASNRYVVRRRARRRALVAAAVAVGILAAASVASAISGVGPLGSIFTNDEFARHAPRPEPGGRRALLEVTGPGGQRWDLLVYRTTSSLTRQRGLRDYCLAVAKGGARPLPPAGARRRPGQSYGFDSIGCQYPPTLAAKIVRGGFELGSGGGSNPSGPLTTYPVFGLALADVRQVSVLEQGGGSTRAVLSRPFPLRIPRLPKRVRDQIESPGQQRATRNLPRSVEVRAFLAVIAPARRPAPLKVTARFGGGRTEIRGLAIARPAPAPRPPDMSPAPGRAQVRLEASAPGGVRWTMRGFQTGDQTTCVAARAAGPRSHPGEGSACASWPGIALGLTRAGVFASRPDRVRSPGTYPVYGLVRGDAREVTVIDPRGRRWRAELSGVWMTLERPGNYLAGARGGLARQLRRLPRSVRLRAFLVVVPSPPPPSTGKGVRFRVKLSDGRTLGGH